MDFEKKGKDRLFEKDLNHFVVQITEESLNDFSYFVHAVFVARLLKFMKNCWEGLLKSWIMGQMVLNQISLILGNLKYCY